MHFFSKRDNFAKYTAFPKKDHISVHTAAGNIHIIGIGKCIVLWRDSNGSLQQLTLIGVGHIPNSGVHLVSIGQLLASSATIQGDRSSICMLYKDGMLLAPFTPLPYFRHNMYTLEVASPQHKAHMITYDIMHKQLRHPSKDVLKHVCNHMHNFPSSIAFPKGGTICPGYMEGKIPTHTVAANGSLLWMYYFLPIFPSFSHPVLCTYAQFTDLVILLCVAIILLYRHSLISSLT